MKEEPFTPSGVKTAEAQPGAPNRTGSPLHGKAEQTAQSAKSEARKLEGTAREQGAVTMDQMKESIHSATLQAQEAGRSFVHNQKENLAKKVSEYAKAARSASECFKGEEGNILAKPAQTAADQLERVSSFLRDTEPAELFDEVESFARRRPEVVLGGMFVLGLAAARFLKASSHRSHSRRYSQGSDWNQRSYASPQESITPLSGSTSMPGSMSTGSTGNVGSTGSTTKPGTSSMPGSSPIGGTGDCGCSTNPNP